MSFQGNNKIYVKLTTHNSNVFFKPDRSGKIFEIFGWKFTAVPVFPIDFHVSRVSN